MAGLFRRLFSKTYRRAVAAEAGGDYIAAAEAYALSKMPAKVSEMHLIRSRRVDAAERIGALEDALLWQRRCPVDDPLASALTSELAASLLEEVRALPKGDPRQRRLADEAATLHEVAGDLKEAGDAHVLVGDRAEALRCYEAAGAIEEMEQLHEADAGARRGASTSRSSFDEYESALARGARDQARAALRQAITAAPAAGYDQILADLERKVPDPGRVELRVNGVRFVVVGRAPAIIGRGVADIALRHGGISRRHAAIDFADDGFAIRDAGSRTGTKLSGIAVSGRVPLRGSGVICVGADCEIEYALDEEASVLELEVLGGLDRGLRALVVRGTGTALKGTDFVVGFRGGWPTISSGSPLLLNGARVGDAVALLTGDTVEHPAGGRIEVLS